MNKLNSKVAHNRPKSSPNLLFLYLKNGSLCNFYMMTLVWTVNEVLGTNNPGLTVHTARSAKKMATCSQLILSTIVTWRQFDSRKISLA